MMDIKNLNLELKVSLLFTVLSLVLSFLTGVVSGAGIGIIAFRLLFLLPLFAGIGYGIVFVLKKYIPEIYDFLNKNVEEKDKNSENDVEFSADDENENMDVDSNDKDYQENSSDKEIDEKFTEFSEGDYPKVDDSLLESTESSANTSKGKLGKHLISESAMAQYEPELMAEAIRTMLLKDGD